MSNQTWDALALILCFGVPMIVAWGVSEDGRIVGGGVDILAGAVIYAAYFFLLRPRL